MAREIKFRVWTDNLKDKWEMYYQYPSKHLSPIFSPAWYWLLNPTLKVMQYTWVKDKDWKEIYEGDIIEWKERSLKPWLTSETVTYVVEWDCMKSWFYLTHIHIYPRNQDSSFRWYNINWPTKKIVWNIYENPELLESNKTEWKKS